MDAKVLFWTGALVNLGVVAGLGVRGVLQVRRGEVEAHRRSMLAAAVLVVAFMGAYVLKLAFLGREDLASWSPAHVGNLWVHELCVLLMILGGAVAYQRSRRMIGRRERTRSPDDEPSEPGVVTWHHRAGWASVAGAVAGLVTACGILAGMYARLG